MTNTKLTIKILLAGRRKPMVHRFTVDSSEVDRWVEISKKSVSGEYYSLSMNGQVVTYRASHIQSIAIEAKQ